MKTDCIKLFSYFASPKLRFFWYMMSIATKLLEKKSSDGTHTHYFRLWKRTKGGGEEKNDNLTGIVFLFYIEFGLPIFSYIAIIAKISPGKWEPFSFKSSLPNCKGGETLLILRTNYSRVLSKRNIAAIPGHYILAICGVLVKFSFTTKQGNIISTNRKLTYKCTDDKENFTLAGT